MGKPLEKFEKRHIEQLTKDQIARDGGTFLKFNWKKFNVHYIGPNGKRYVTGISYQSRPRSS